MRTLRLEAEAEAWPLCSPQAFHRGLVEWAPQDLRVGLDDRLAAYGPRQFPWDPCVATWTPLPDEQPPGHVLDWLRLLARRRLRLEGIEARLQLSTAADAARETIRWRFLSLRVPGEVLVAALAADEGLGFTPGRVSLLPPLLDTDIPTAHLHLHLSAAGLPADAWRRVDRHLEQGRPLPEPIGRAWGAGHGSSTDREHALGWEQALSRARLCERLLDRFLGVPDDLALEEWLARRGDAETTSAVWELARGRLLRPESSPEREERIRCGEPLGPGGDPEARKDPDILRRGLLRLRRRGKDGDPWLKAVLVQWIRVRCLFHQAVVVDPTRPGLQRFVQQFRDSTDLGGGTLVDPDAPSRHSSLHVQAVEIRVTPGRGLQTARDQSGRNGSVERAVVVHLTRERDRQSPDGSCPWPAQARRALRQARALCDDLAGCIEAEPDLARVLRGIDLAGDEAEGPLWVFAPALRELRSGLDESFRRVGVRGPGMTLHCGESFRHLLTGLRAVSEPMLTDLVRPGDRLGHALALGLSPEPWAKRNDTVWVPAVERWIDLLWVPHVIRSWCVPVDAGTLLRLDGERRELQRKLFAGMVPGTWLDDPEQVIPDLYSLRPEDIPAAGAAPDLGAAPAAMLLILSPERWQRAQRLVPVRTTDEVPLLCQLQAALAREVARSQLVVEVNPSSNLLIADLDAPLDQPMFHLRPVVPNDHRVLPLCISTDDPLLFDTTLDDEVAYAWAGMMAGGDVSAAHARAWLEDALRVAWRARFSLPRPSPPA
ncbi:hypothetical protein L6R53_08745 [Myxococcota bacterium]|nr:hypothetical protein [Myxococcota bacterium]